DDAQRRGAQRDYTQGRRSGRRRHRSRHLERGELGPSDPQRPQCQRPQDQRPQDQRHDPELRGRGHQRRTARRSREVRARQPRCDGGARSPRPRSTPADLDDAVLGGAARALEGPRSALLPAQEMKPLLFRFTGALSVSLALLPQPAGAASSPEAARADSTERARDLFERGIAAWDANQLEEALVLLTESWELSRSFDGGGSLGQVEELLGRHRDAAEHLHHSLRNFPVGESRELRANIEATLQKAMAQVGSVRVLVDEPQARLIVDGEDVGEAPGDGYVFVEPGAHTILARLGARTSETRTLEVQAGGKYVVDLALAPEAMPPARAPGALTQGRSGAAEWKLPVMLGAGAFAM